MFLLVILLGIILVAVPQWYVKSTYKKYLKEQAQCGLTGYEVAQEILNSNGLGSHVRIEPTPGQLSDHFDPRSNTVRLSEDNYYGRSISAVSVAAHEVGHAIQHNQGYIPIKFRSAFFPVASTGDRLGGILLIVGILLATLLHIEFLGTFIAVIGLLFYSAAVLFQFITLPVEFNASSRALKNIKELGIVQSSELAMSQSVLTAAALTYVASALYAVLNLLYYAWLIFGREN